MNAMLQEYLQKALELGMDELVIDYKDGQERVTAQRGHLGVGIGSIPSGSRESETLFNELEALRKAKRVKLGQVQYRASVNDFESFGEWAHCIRLTQVTVEEHKAPPQRSRRHRPG